MDSKFNYEDKTTIEGRGEVSTGSHDLASLRLERLLADVPAGQVTLLEIGCGAGRHTRAIKRYRPRSLVYGCDISANAIEEAKKADGGVDYRLGDALNLPYEDGFFNIVCILDVLEHVEDPGKALAEVHRVLKPGGYFLAYVPLEGNPGTIYQILSNSHWLPLARWKREHVGHIQQFTEADIMELLAQNRFKLRKKSFSFHVTGQIHDLADYWFRDANRWGGPVKRLIAKVVTKPIFMSMWRLAYYEDMLRKSDPNAAGLHISAIAE